MSSLMLTIFVLMWPAIAAGVMVLLCVSLYKDMRKAKKEIFASHLVPYFPRFSFPLEVRQRLPGLARLR